MIDRSLLGTARSLRDRLTPGDLDATLAQITAAAVEVLPNVQYSSITICRPDGELSTAAPTDPMILRLNLDSSEIGAFDDVESLSSLFAHQAGLAISYAHHIGTLEEEVKSRTTIGRRSAS